MGVADFVLPNLLAKLGKQEPEINIELVATDSTANLLLREADIAIRMFRPTQANFITRKVSDLHLGVYATTEYLARRGTPVSIDDVGNHDLVGDDRGDEVLTGLKSLGLQLDRDTFRYLCEDRMVEWNLVFAGCGIGITHTCHGDSDPRVERVLDNIEIALPIWLTSHSELKTSARVRIVFDFLAEELKALS